MTALRMRWRRFDKGLLWLLLTSALSIAATIFFLDKGISNIFQHLYYIPIMIACVLYQRKGFYYSLALSLLYLALIITFTGDYQLLLLSMIRVALFVVVAAVVSYLSNLNQEQQIAIAESKEHYEMLVSNVPGVTFRCLNDEDWTMRFISDEITRLTGYPVSDFIDNNVRSYASLIHPEDMPQIKKQILESTLRKQPFQIEYRLITAEKETLWVAEKGAGLLNAEGSVEQFTGVIVDITQKKANSIALRESRELLRATLDSIVDGVIATDRQGNVTGLNTVAEQLTGWNIKEAKLKHIDEVFNTIPSDEDQKAVNVVSLALEKGIVQKNPVNCILIAKDGSQTRISKSCAPITDDKSNIVGAVIVLRDITEEYQLQKEIRDSEERFNQIATQSRIVVWEVDPEGTFTFLSDAAATVYGYHPYELSKRKQMFDLRPKKLREEYKANILSHFERKEILSEVITPITSKEEKLVWVSTNAIPLVDDSGRLVGYRGSDRDITPRIKAQQALKENEQLYRSITENSYNTIALLDLSGNYQYCNKAHKNILGYSADELLGRNSLDLIHPDDRKKVSRDLHAGIYGKKHEAFYVHRVRCKDGSYKLIDNKVSLFKTSDDSPEQLLVIGSDITQRTEVKSQLRKTNERLSNLLSHTGDILFVLDKHHRIKEYYCSDEANLLMNPDAFLDKNIDDLALSKDSSEKIRQALIKSESSEAGITTEYKACLQGTTKWYSLTVNSIHKNDDVRYICIIDDITKRKQAEEKLNFQHSFNQLLTIIARNFVKAAEAGFDEKITSALEKIGKFLKMDRCWVFLLDEDFKYAANTHKWSADDIKDDSLQIQKKIYCDDVPWLCEEIGHKNNDIVFSDPQELNPQARKEICEFLLKGVQSVCLLPLKTDKNVFGFVGFDGIKEKIEWDEKIVTMLHLFTGLLAEAVLHKKVEEQMIEAQQKAATMAMIVSANHEINQPLMVIQGYFEILKNKYPDKSYSKYYDEIKKAVNRIKKILESMSEIRKVEFTEYVEGTDMLKLPKDKNHSGPDE